MEKTASCVQGNLTVMGGENTCTDCGIAQGAEHVDDNICRNADTHTNLFITHPLGARNYVPGMEGMPAVKRCFRGGMWNEHLLSCLSYVCGKLKLPEHACMAIFWVGRGGSVPIPDIGIVEATEMAAVQKMRGMAQTAYRHMHIAENVHTDGKGNRYYLCVGHDHNTRPRTAWFFCPGICRGDDHGGRAGEAICRAFGSAICIRRGRSVAGV